MKNDNDRMFFLSFPKVFESHLVSIHGYATLFIFAVICLSVLSFWKLVYACNCNISGYFIGLDLLVVYALWTR